MKYVAPEMEITVLGTEDILTASDGKPDNTTPDFDV